MIGSLEGVEKNDDRSFVQPVKLQFFKCGGSADIPGIGDAEERFFDCASRSGDRETRSPGKNKASGRSAQNDDLRPAQAGCVHVTMERA